MWSLWIDERSIKHRRTVNVTCIHENIMIFGQVIVSTSLDVSTQIILGWRLSLIFTIIHAVITPIAGIWSTTGNKGTQLILIVFQLCKYTFIHNEAIIITTQHIAHIQFLIYISRVATHGRIIFCRNILSIVRINKISTAKKVCQNILVQAFVITKINTSIEIKIFTEFCSICRE